MAEAHRSRGENLLFSSGHQPVSALSAFALGGNVPSHFIFLLKPYCVLCPEPLNPIVYCIQNPVDAATGVGCVRLF
jgi:hypothetical protein